ncbi:MAG TPA: CheR family methyltransferase [Verrucomicrobiae bacterium]|nr:CheR family methyltransferase [Verrucomicrobiae bacterium]
MERTFGSSPLADEDYHFICKVVYDQSRIHLGKDKKTLVSSRLAKRLHHLQLPNYGEYCRLLRSSEGSDEVRFLIDRISTNHTHFFREIRHFDFLRQTAIPQWSARLSSRRETFRLWSAACSTGEEPFSLAIHLAEHYQPADPAAWFIEGTDISTRVLEQAKGAIYSTEHAGAVGPELLRKYFQKGTGKWDGYFRVKESLRRCVRFHHLNLLEGKYPFVELFHVILCRNVMIYFDKPTQEDLIARLTERLAPGGYLLVGHSESLSGIRHSLRLVQPAVYLKQA